MEALELDHAACSSCGSSHGHTFSSEASRTGLCCVHWITRYQQLPRKPSPASPTSCSNYRQKQSCDMTVSGIYNQSVHGLELCSWSRHNCGLHCGPCLCSVLQGQSERPAMGRLDACCWWCGDYLLHRHSKVSFHLNISQSPLIMCQICICPCQLTLNLSVAVLANLQFVLVGRHACKRFYTPPAICLWSFLP